MDLSSIPVIGFTGYSGAGKTTLLINLISLFKAQNIRTGIIKHAHQSFEIDHPEKDSYKLRKAGADQVLVGSKKRWALIVESEADYSLNDYLRYLHTDSLDLVLIEKLNSVGIPKIEVHRPSLGQPLLCDNDHDIIAVATDGQINIDSGIPVLDLNQPAQIADFINDKFISTNKQIIHRII